VIKHLTRTPRFEELMMKPAASNQLVVVVVPKTSKAKKAEELSKGVQMSISEKTYNKEVEWEEMKKENL